MGLIYVWCNSSSPEWHSMMAMAEDGSVLAHHVCSAHGFAFHDMGIDEGGWKRDKYAEHYPDGFEVVWVESPKSHDGLMAAYALNQKRRETREAEVSRREGPDAGGRE